MRVIMYKVLRNDLSSLQLLGAPRMVYRPGQWNTPQEPISEHPRKGGGLWTTPTLSAAKSVRRYMRSKYGIETRIFLCKIGRILHQTSCRVKTDRLFFTAEDEVLD